MRSSSCCMEASTGSGANGAAGAGAESTPDRKRAGRRVTERLVDVREGGTRPGVEGYHRDVGSPGGIAALPTDVGSAPTAVGESRGTPARRVRPALYLRSLT